MHVVIVGAGQVGTSIATDLQADHDVVVIDRHGERAGDLAYSLDILTVTGDGTDLEVLEEAGVGEANMVLAATDDDETNIAVCATAKAVSDAFTIARVKQGKYLRTWERSEGAFGIDFMVCTNLLTAETIARIVGLPMARDADVFSSGQVWMAEFEIDAESPITGWTVEEADRFDSLTFAAVLRNGDVEITRGSTRIEAGDKVVVIGSPESIGEFARTLAPEESPAAAAEVVIIGGSEIGYHVARLLSEQGLSPHLIEQDATRARQLAEDLPKTVVMEADATDMGFLEREHVSDADVLVACLDGDEKNLLEALLAERLGVQRTVAVIDRTPYVELFESVGVDVGVSPRSVVAEEITRFTQAGKTENVAFIETDKAEVVEIEVDPDSVLVGRPISKSVADLPDGVVIGAITRDGEFVVPRGDTVVKPKDHVVLFVDTEVLDDVTRKL